VTYGNASDDCVAGGVIGSDASCFDRFIKGLEGLCKSIQYCKIELEKVIIEMTEDTAH
jgi:hypothetical protein